LLKKMIICKDCKFCYNDVTIIVKDKEMNKIISARFFENFCTKHFQPCDNSGVIVGCTEGEKRE